MTFLVAFITLSRLDGFFRCAAAIRGKRTALVVRLVESAAVVAADVTLIGTRVDQLALVRFSSGFRLAGLARAGGL